MSCPPLRRFPEVAMQSRGLPRASPLLLTARDWRSSLASQHGTGVEVPTVDGGRAKITIPAGTQSGFQFRLKSKGMSILRSKERGDMFVEALVETPVNLSKRQKEILKEFENEGKNKKNNPETEGFFSKVRDLWEDLKD